MIVHLKNLLCTSIDEAIHNFQHLCLLCQGRAKFAGTNLSPIFNPSQLIALCKFKPLYYHLINITNGSLQIV